MHAALRITLGHLLVEDAAAGGHPLHVARAKTAAIPEAVTMVDRACQHIGDRFDAAVRMPRKPGEVVVRVVVPEIVEQQERIEFIRGAKTKRATQVHSRAFEHRRRLRNALYWAD